MKLISSNFYISIQGSVDIFDQVSINHITKTFEEIFPKYEIVSDVSTEDYKEVIYSINTPLLKDGEALKEFYCDLEILLEELKEYNPHFTQFGGEK